MSVVAGKHFGKQVQKDTQQPGQNTGKGQTMNKKTLQIKVDSKDKQKRTKKLHNKLD